MAQFWTTAENLTVVDDRVDPNETTERDIVFGDFNHSSLPFEEKEWPVIIMGSSLVGMFTGLLLGYHGIQSISFDRHPTIHAHPRAAGLSFRTSEILRQLGLEQYCLERSVREYDLDAGLVVVEQLVSDKPPRVVQDHDVEKDAKITPCKWMWVTQPMLEPMLIEKSNEYNYDLQYNRKIVHYEEVLDGVIVVVQNLETKLYKKYKTQYLVACDGNRSATRRREGIPMNGHGVLSNGVTVSFKADFQNLLGHLGRHGVLYIKNGATQGAFRQEERGKGGNLYINSIEGRKDFSSGSLTKDDALRYIYECSGFSKDAEVELQSIAYWTLASYLADRFTSKGGRVLIAGDAAHITPPTGALGGNTGVQDAHNLAWKLAYVLSGRAAPSLLNTYELERKPVDGYIVEQATRRYYNRIEGRSPPMPEEPYYTVEMGTRYGAGAILPAEGETFDKNFEDPHFPTGSAGSRFPHVRLEASDGNFISSLDLIKQNFVLIVTDDGSPWLAAAEAMKFRIDTYAVHETSQPYADRLGSLKQKARLSADQALLVRPDGYIAWRANSLQSDHRESLQEALKQLLGKPVK